MKILGENCNVDIEPDLQTNILNDTMKLNGIVII
jgi:hypothetical protein